MSLRPGVLFPIIALACIPPAEALAADAGAGGTVRSATPFALAARHAVLLDPDSGDILLAHKAATPFAPASMTKMMTAYLAFAYLREGGLSLDDRFKVSVKAWKMEGSRMFLEPESLVTVRDLLRGVIVHSGNDAAVTLAEGLGVTEDGFVQRMNATAARLGMNATLFRNSSGLPEAGHVSTAYDLALLASRTLRDFSEYYPMYGERAFTHNGIRQSNRNPLLGAYEGVDGLKTGHTDDSGYAVTLSARRGERRLILVASGYDSPEARARESRALLDWGFRTFALYEAFAAGAPVVEAPLWLGAEDGVTLTVARDALFTLPRLAAATARLEAVFEAPVRAPVRQGRVLGKLRVTLEGGVTRSVPLVAAHDVAETPLFLRPLKRLLYLLGGG